MSNGKPNPPIGSKFILEGRVVTMGPDGVIDDGAIYIEDGAIKHVLPSSAPQPDGFQNVKRIRTGDTIYPGLIELHNHLSYNAMPLWDVPRRFTNNGQWTDHSDYPRLITKPTQVLAGTEGVVEALIRYVECRALLGGVTTSQGVTLSSERGIKSFYKGLVRNVEHVGDPLFPAAGTRIENPKAGGAQAYLNTLKKEKSCYLQHLSEGVDDTARGWFLNMELDSGEWAVTEVFCGIHSTALNQVDFEIIHDRGGSMVWSPLSNYLLYGDTVKLEAAQKSKILMGLGSDWAPSGSKNLLGEIKVAWLASELQGRIFSAEEILAMATINAARILKWQDVLGSIEPGKRADFMVLNGRSGDPFMQVVEARETTLTLVVIDGVPRIGQVSVMKRFGYKTSDLEKIKVGDSTRLLNLAEENTHPLMAGLTLTEAIQRLEIAMADLPALAEQLDANTGSGLFSGSADSTGSQWRVVLDFEEEATDLALAAKPLADFVTEPMALPGIAVADDPSFLRDLMAARNLPLIIKEWLPPLYGESIPPSASGSFLRQERDLPPEVAATTIELHTFLRTTGELSRADRLLIVDQALVLLEQNYVHLSFKESMHAVDPVQRLRLLRYRMENTPEGSLPAEIEFHNELAAIFNALRDLHTTYRLPSPFRGKFAWLPFIVEEYWEGDHRRFMVSNVVGKPGPESFKDGVEVLHWNGAPIEQVVAQNAERQAGSNLAARWARGLNSLTIRPLANGLPPDEKWVRLQYRYTDKEDKEHTKEWTQPWLLFEPGRSPNSVIAGAGHATATALGLDAHTDDIQEAKRVLYAGEVVMREREAARKPKDEAITNMELDGALDTFLPTIFRAMEVEGNGKKYGYIRIFSFNVADADGFVDEFVRLAGNLPQIGLIVDVRGNGGGLIYAAEELLQVLTPRWIGPQRAQFINTPINLQICRNHEESTQFPGLVLRPWITSIEQAVATGSTYSLSFPISDEGRCNARGQAYYGPVVLITDALCYSATDMFAAGFQDHGIGPVLGTSDNTGAGGANVWSHNVLRRLMATSDPAALRSPYAQLPRGADLRVAIRRTLRVGDNLGVVLEDLGVQPNEPYRLTRRDVLGHNEDLIAKAVSLLAGRKAYTFKVRQIKTDGELPRLRVESRHVSRLDVYFDNHPLATLKVARRRTDIDLPALVGEVVPAGRTIELRGFDGDDLVAAYRKKL